MRLVELSTGRENNLNLVRLVAASAVLFSHSFALSTGSPSVEPLRSTIGMTLGTIAVDVFFLVSGFLVTASISRSESIVDFAISRALRIFPGLIVMLVVTVFGLGLAFTTISFESYLTSPKIYKYLAKCATLFFGMEFRLPGVFEANPYKFSVNGSLWTLPYEVKMYGMLAMLWIALRSAGKRQPLAQGASCLVSVLLSGSYLIYQNVSKGQGDTFLWLFFMFFSGSSYFTFRKYIKLSTVAVCIMVGALLIASQVSRPAFSALYMISITYITFYFSYVPRGVIRRYNNIGDFSYGIYIYAFPIQQAVTMLVPGISPVNLFIWSGMATLGVSIVSWTTVEKQALKLKRPLVDLSMQKLGYRRQGLRWQRVPAT